MSRTFGVSVLAITSFCLHKDPAIRLKHPNYTFRARVSRTPAPAIPLPFRLVDLSDFARVESLARHAGVLSYGMEVAREYGRLKQYLQSKGRPLPEKDIWIAAAATC